MDVQEVEVIINKNGQVQIQVRGIKGTQCLDITQDLEQALGGNVSLRELTPEALEELKRNPRQVHVKGGK
jgi:hypothetical protein